MQHIQMQQSLFASFLYIYIHGLNKYKYLIIPDMPQPPNPLGMPLFFSASVPQSRNQRALVAGHPAFGDFEASAFFRRVSGNAHSCLWKPPGVDLSFWRVVRPLLRLRFLLILASTGPNVGRAARGSRSDNVQQFKSLCFYNSILCTPRLIANVA